MVKDFHRCKKKKSKCLLEKSKFSYILVKLASTAAAAAAAVIAGLAKKFCLIQFFVRFSPSSALKIKHTKSNEFSARHILASGKRGKMLEKIKKKFSSHLIKNNAKKGKRSVASQEFIFGAAAVS